MQQKTITKQFSQFIDKRFYFSDDITSLTLSHPYLQDLNGCKQKKVKGYPMYTSLFIRHRFDVEIPRGKFVEIRSILKGESTWKL